MITRYKEYLEYIDKSLQKKFDAQKEYIKCKAGCDFCCKEGEFPLSELEYIYLMFFFSNLDEDKKNKIKQNIEELLIKHERLYKCPFLIDGLCSVYPARGIICRTFGLIYYEKDSQKVPFCIDLGLNYSNSKINKNYNKEYTAKTEPLAYNISRTILRSEKFEKDFDLFFGEDKTMIEWLREDF